MSVGDFSSEITLKSGLMDVLVCFAARARWTVALCRAPFFSRTDWQGTKLWLRFGPGSYQQTTQSCYWSHTRMNNIQTDSRMVCRCVLVHYCSCRRKGADTPCTIAHMQYRCNSTCRPLQLLHPKVHCIQFLLQKWTHVVILPLSAILCKDNGVHNHAIKLVDLFLYKNTPHLVLANLFPRSKK